MCLEGEERTKGFFRQSLPASKFNDFDSNNALSFGQFDQLIDVEQHRSCARFWLLMTTDGQNKSHLIWLRAYMRLV